MSGDLFAMWDCNNMRILLQSYIAIMGSTDYFDRITEDVENERYGGVIRICVF